MTDEPKKETLFYSVCYKSEDLSAPTYTNKMIKDFDGAERVAKKVATEYRCPVYIMAPAYLVEAPMPEATMTKLS